MATVGEKIDKIEQEQDEKERAAQTSKNILQMVVSNWKTFTPKRHMRKRLKNYQELQLKEIPGASAKTGTVMHAALTSEIDSEEYQVDGYPMHTGMRVRNHALIHYIAKLAVSNHNNDTFDFEFVQSLLKNGADINATDKYGQTVFHEVARSWHADVAEFLIRNGKVMNLIGMKLGVASNLVRIDFIFIWCKSIMRFAYDLKQRRIQLKMKLIS